VAASRAQPLMIEPPSAQTVAEVTSVIAHNLNPGSLLYSMAMRARRAWVLHSVVGARAKYQRSL